MRTRGEPAPPTPLHQRAVVAFRELGRMFPLELARWLEKRAAHEEPIEIHEATFVEGVPKGPAYKVSPPPEPAPKRTPEAALKSAVLGGIERDLAGSGLQATILRVDWAEEMRQTLVRGGGDLDLFVGGTQTPKKKKRARKSPVPFKMLLGAVLPSEGDDGGETHWRCMQVRSWHLLAHRQLAKDPDAMDKGPITDLVVLYLWPGTGLKDWQEDCSVLRRDDKLPGLLGKLLQDESQREQDRELNLQRLAFHERHDRARRQAAARRRELLGDAGISEEELAALVPSIDVDHDRISMWMTYPVARLWEEPVEALLAELPPECAGLALFGLRPAGTSHRDVLTQCAWVLRSRLRDAEAGHLIRAAAGLAIMAAVFLEAAEIERTLTTMKLLG